MNEFFTLCGAVVALFCTLVIVIGGGYFVYSYIKDDMAARRELEMEQNNGRYYSALKELCDVWRGGEMNEVRDCFSDIIKKFKL